MKKLFMLLVTLVFSGVMFGITPAKTVRVTTLETFDASNPPQVLHIQMNGNARLDYDLMLFQGFQVTGRVVPQGESFVFVPVSYVNYQEENMTINKEYPAVYKGRRGIVRQNQPFTLIFNDNGNDSFQYYVPSVSDMN